MPTAVQETECLLRDIAAAFVEKPDEVSVCSTEAMDGAVIFGMRCAEQDEPLLIGKGGSHAAAFGFLVEQFGKAEGREYIFRLITAEKDPEWREMAERTLREYSPTKASELLSGILENLEIESFAVSFLAKGELYDFTIEVSSKHDFYTLLKPTEFVLNRSADGRPLDKKTTFIVAELGALFRAIGRRAGVKFQITVEKP